MNHKRLPALLISAVILLTTVACQNPEAPEDTTAEDVTTAAPQPEQDAVVTAFTEKFTASGVQSDYPDASYVMMIGDEPVTYDEYVFYNNSYRAYFDKGSADYWTTYPEMEAVVAQMMKNELKQRHAVFAEAERLGISLTEAEIRDLDSAVKDDIDGFGGEEYLRAGLAEYSESLWFYYYDNAITYLTEKLKTAYKDAGSLPDTDEELTAYALSDNCVRFFQIAFVNDSGESADENRKAADEAYEKLQAGADFEALMQEYSDDKEGMEYYPDGYLLTRSSLEETTRAALYALTPGTCSTVIETYYGFTILKRLTATEAFVTGYLEELRETVASTYTSDTLDTAAAALTVTYHPAYADGATIAADAFTA